MSVKERKNSPILVEIFAVTLEKVLESALILEQEAWKAHSKPSVIETQQGQIALHNSIAHFRPGKPKCSEMSLLRSIIPTFWSTDAESATLFFMNTSIILLFFLIGNEKATDPLT
jgi:hypothetical protein